VDDLGEPIVAKNMSMLMKSALSWVARTKRSFRAACAAVGVVPPKHAVTGAVTKPPPGAVVDSPKRSGCARRKSVHCRVSPSLIGPGVSGAPHVWPAGQSPSTRQRLLPSEHTRQRKRASGTSRQTYSYTARRSNAPLKLRRAPAPTPHIGAAPSYVCGRYSITVEVIMPPSEWPQR